MIVFTAIFLLMFPASASRLEDFQDINCSSTDPAQRLQDAGEAGNCLSAVRDQRYHQEFEKCKENVCFLFIHEPPIVTYSEAVFQKEDNVKQMQLPFLCKNPSARHRSLGGLAFDILGSTSAREEYCAWVGPLHSCTWNALVDFATMKGKEEGYQFALVGPMLETPQRKCYHFASTSWWDGKMVVVGRNKRENMVTVHPVWQLISPFQPNTWIVVGSVIALFVIVCLLIVYRFHVFRGKSIITAITAYFVFMGEGGKALATGRVAREEECSRQRLRSKASSSIDLEAASSLQSSSSYEDVSLQNDFNDSKREVPLVETEQKEAFLTKFSLATSLFRISLIAFLAMFSLFYEVAVVNFLFQQQSLQITKDVIHFTLDELTKYALVQDTAMEAIWNMRGKDIIRYFVLTLVSIISDANAYRHHLICERNVSIPTVNPRSTKFDERNKSQIPWKRCQNGAECFSWLLDEKNPVQFYVTYELDAMHLIQTKANCELVTMFATKGTIYEFNSGWLFTEQVPSGKRRNFDRELGALKISGRLSELIGRIPELCAPNLGSSIAFLIILLPVAFLVLPPLVCSALVAICWRTINTKEDNESPVLPDSNTPIGQNGGETPVSSKSRYLSTSFGDDSF